LQRGCGMDFDAFIDDFDEETTLTEADRDYWTCFSLYDNGMILAAHAVMLRNIDNCVDLGEKQSDLYEKIKHEHTMASSKSCTLLSEEEWVQKGTPQQRADVGDSLQIFKHVKKDSTFLLETKVDMTSAECIALASRLEFSDSWMSVISESFLVRQLSRHTHLVCLLMENPISSYLEKQKMYVRIDTFDNTVFDKSLMVVVKPLTVADCYKYNINDHQQKPIIQFYAFSSVTFLFRDIKASDAQHTRTCAKIYVEDMKVFRYTPEYFNTIVCMRLFSKMCRLWADTARQLGDILYDEVPLAKLIAYIERGVAY